MSFTVNTPPAQDARIAATVGRRLNLKAVDGITPRSATGAEVKQFVLDWLKMTVREDEQSVAREAANASVTDITPT